MPQPESNPSDTNRGASNAIDTRRALHLDALRGIAAIIVFNMHFSGALFPYRVFGDAEVYPPQHAWDGIFLWPPLGLLTAGNFAVCLFFVLSGYVLSIRFIGERDSARELVVAIIKRPFRLAGLTLLSLVLAACLWAMNALWFREAASLAGSSAWFGEFWPGQFSWQTFFSDLFHARSAHEYNPPLWTIRVELIGSFLVFGSLFALNLVRYRVRVLILLAMIVALHGSYYDGFLIGMMFADAVKHRPHLFHTQSRSGKTFNVAVLIAAIAVASYPYYASDAIWLWLKAHGVPDFAWIEHYTSMVSATLMFLAVSRLPALQRALRRPLLVWLGDVSFGVYVLHFLFLGSIGAWLYVTLVPTLGHTAAAWSSIGISLALLLPAASLAIRYVDRPAIRMGERAGALAGRAIFRQPDMLRAG